MFSGVVRLFGKIRSRVRLVALPSNLLIINQVNIVKIVKLPFLEARCD
ncbi:MAG: hypothetical protein RIS64_2917 [Bacteroidota bacterium]|jgi:hypothetical protein